METTMRYLIVTRHTGAIEWLRRRGITGDVVTHATADQVRGRHVVGVLPIFLAAYAASVTSIDVPNMPDNARGRELSADEMDAFGARLSRYVVREMGVVASAIDAAADHAASESSAAVGNEIAVALRNALGV